MAKRLKDTARAPNVKRHHMSNLQHNKTIVVDGPKTKAVVCGSTNFTWRGMYVQSNNAVVMRGAKAIPRSPRRSTTIGANDNVNGFGITASAKWIDLA